MRKFSSFLLGIVLVSVGISGCGTQESPQPKSSSPKSNENTNSTKQDTNVDAPPGQTEPEDDAN